MSDYVVWDGVKYPIDFDLPMRRLDEICQKNGISLIKPTRVYEHYEYDTHPNAVGNLRMAEGIVDSLVDSTFIGEVTRPGVSRRRLPGGLR